METYIYWFSKETVGKNISIMNCIVLYQKGVGKWGPEEWASNAIIPRAGGSILVPANVLYIYIYDVSRDWALRCGILIPIVYIGDKRKP